MRRKFIIRSLLTSASVLMISASGALAAKTPNILVSSTNQVPACVTPERLMEFVGWRNKKVAPVFNDTASYYQAHGNNLGIRWDYAFYQMLVETNYLKFRAPNGRMGAVKPHQKNFAGLGATGGGVPGESFKTVSDGVLAHLQHIQMYSGNRVANPIATRTRNIQDWEVILPWAQAFGREVNFTDLTTKWSPQVIAVIPMISNIPPVNSVDAIVVVRTGSTPPSFHAKPLSRHRHRRAEMSLLPLRQFQKPVQIWLLWRAMRKNEPNSS